jgi:two-component sensor histidine kinase
MPAGPQAPEAVRHFPFATPARLARAAVLLPAGLILLAAGLAVWTASRIPPAYVARYTLLYATIIAASIAALTLAVLDAHRTSLRVLALLLLATFMAAPYLLASAGAPLSLQIVPAAAFATLLFAGLLFPRPVMIALGAAVFANLVTVSALWGGYGGSPRLVLVSVNYALVIGLVVLWCHLARALVLRTHGEARAAGKLRERAEELAAALEAANRELDHRVKNNLQTVMGIVNLHRRKVRSRGAAEVLQTLHGRIRAIAVVEEIFDGAAQAPGSRAGLAEFLEALAGHIAGGYAPTPVRMDLALEIDGVTPRAGTALPLALAVHELLMNAVVHGTAGVAEPWVGITARRSAAAEASVLITVRDGGSGLAQVPDLRDLERLDGLGLTLVSTLIESLGGSVSIAPGPGAHVTISIPSHQFDGS